MINVKGAALVLSNDSTMQVAVKASTDDAVRDLGRLDLRG